MQSRVSVGLNSNFPLNSKFSLPEYKSQGLSLERTLSVRHITILFYCHGNHQVIQFNCDLIYEVEVVILCIIRDYKILP
jgi:hypothetical protein